ERKNLVNPVQELRVEMPAQGPVPKVLLRARLQPQPAAPASLIAMMVRFRFQGSGVAGHKDQGVAEVDFPVAGGEHQPAGIEHIKQGPGDLLAGLFKFVEQDNARFAERSLNLLKIKQDRKSTRLNSSHVKISYAV